MIHIKTAFPNARKDRQCQDCLLLIKRGDIYRRDTFRDDDSVYNWSAHIPCHSEAAHHHDGDENGWSEGYLVNDIDRSDWRPVYAAWYELTRAAQAEGGGVSGAAGNMVIWPRECHYHASGEQSTHRFHE